MLEPVAAANGGWPNIRWRRPDRGRSEEPAHDRFDPSTARRCDRGRLGWPRPAMSGWSPAPARWILAATSSSSPPPAGPVPHVWEAFVLSEQAGGAGTRLAYDGEVEWPGARPGQGRLGGV